VEKRRLHTLKKNDSWGAIPLAECIAPAPGVCRGPKQNCEKPEETARLRHPHRRTQSGNGTTATTLEFEDSWRYDRKYVPT